MNLATQKISTYDSTQMGVSANQNEQADSGELTINIQTNSVHPAVQNGSRLQDEDNSQDLVQLLFDTLKEMNEQEKCKMVWTSANEVNLSMISSRALHHFLLKAEELGQNITYNRTLSVKISK